MPAPAMRAGSQRRDQIGLDHDRSARGVDQIGAGFHQREFAGGDQAAGPIAEHDMDREDVGEAEQIVLLDAPHTDRRSGFLGEVLTPRDHRHARTLRIGGHALADAAESEQAERATRQDRAHRGLPPPARICRLARSKWRTMAIISPHVSSGVALKMPAKIGLAKLECATITPCSVAASMSRLGRVIPTMVTSLRFGRRSNRVRGKAHPLADGAEDIEGP